MSRPTATRFPIIWLLTLAVSIFIGFAAIFEIDQAVRAQGQVIPSSRTQVIQALDGGVLTGLYVKEGDRVRMGQKLAVLEPDRAQANFAQSSAEVASKRIALVRAQAELSGRPLAFTREQQGFAQFVDAQHGIYRQRKQSLDEETELLKKSLQLAQNELLIHQRLHENGDISENEVMRSQRQVLDLEKSINGLRNRYLQEARIEVARLEDELSASRYKRDERQSVLKHTDLTSSMDGVVKYVRITTVGGVLKPGDELMQISPIDDELLLEIKVNPADIGQLKPGLTVTLRFDTFDSSIYGNVKGILRYISPDTLNEQGSNGQSQIYYRAHVAIDWSASRQQSSNHIQPKDIKPGMTATADVLTGQRSLLKFLMKPVNRAFSGALTQR